MTYANKINGTWALVYPGIPFVDATGISRPGNWLELASDTERDAAEVFAVPEPDAPPAGKVEAGRVPVGKDRPVWQVTYADAPVPPKPMAPDNPTLGDWRVGLVQWKTPTGNRRDEVLAKIRDLLASGHPLGPVADERVNYSNNVLREQLMVLKDAVGFSTEDVEESLWRAEQVRQGDLSGVWPSPAAREMAA